MKKTRRFMTAVIAAALAAAMPISALAQTVTGAEGGTNFGIVQTTTMPTNVSFELPLYVTMAVVSNETAVVMPETYKIKNLASASNADSYDIQVTGMSVEKVAGSTFNLTTETSQDSITKSQINLKIGGATLPALTQAGKVTKVDLKGSTLETAKIAPEAELDIALEGTVLGTGRTASDAAAQFKVTYTVSAVDATGAVVGNAYSGDSASAAGMETTAASN